MIACVVTRQRELIACGAIGQHCDVVACRRTEAVDDPRAIRGEKAIVGQNPALLAGQDDGVIAIERAIAGVAHAARTFGVFIGDR
ncbi:MAG: hypothetical protein CSB44_00335 [Gammaproteobacteria bacterium]|nr:MAG: hypothetical protein CSB44_00335 [Gammaproteobacteria bacterium]